MVCTPLSVVNVLFPHPVGLLSVHPIASATFTASRLISGVNLIGNFWGGGDDDTACRPKFESLIHIIGHDKTSVEDNLY